MLDFKHYDPTQLVVTLRDGKKLYGFNLSPEGKLLWDQSKRLVLEQRIRSLTGWEVIQFDTILETERTLPTNRVGYVIKGSFKFYYGQVFVRNRWLFVPIS